MIMIYSLHPKGILKVDSAGIIMNGKNMVVDRFYVRIYLYSNNVIIIIPVESLL